MAIGVSIRFTTVMCLLLGMFVGGATLRGQTDRVKDDEETLRKAGIGLDADALLEFFRKRTLDGGGQKAMQVMISQLGDGAFRVREKASSSLVALGMPAVPYLREALKSTDIEVVRRAEGCLRMIEERDSRVGLPAAAARLLAARKPDGTIDVLLAFLPFSENEAVSEEIQNTLSAVAMRDGKPAKEITEHLHDADPIRRAAAAVALCRAKGSIELVRPLLKDADFGARLQVAVAMATRKETDAVPVLIELLETLPPSKAWRAEDVLIRLAGEQAPTAALGKDMASRQRCRLAWAKWWSTNADRVDLATLDRQSQLLNYTMLVLLDAGQVVEIGPDEKERLKFEGLQFPLDAQILPGDRLLVAEHQADRVTERNRRGEVLWQKAVSQPLVAQRLPNGHTFIASENKLLEVDREGKEVYNLTAPDGGKVMKALKRSNGEISVITHNRRYFRMDTSGKELHSFPVQLNTSGGRLELLANGHILIPEVNNNRIVEFDAAGQVVWSSPFNKPLAAVRLVNGNTLVTAYQDTKAIEIDRNGKEVWTYKGDARITRAFRR